MTSQIPLYENVKYAWKELANAPTAHPGLRFDKFCNGWSTDWQQKLPDNAKKEFYEATARRRSVHLQQGLKKFLSRQENLINALSGQSLEVQTDWRFVSGLGSSHPYETGFIWHRSLGVPFLPGPSAKGLVRAWAEQWCDESTKSEAIRLFGPKDNEHKKNANTGALIIFDGLPANIPKLEVDILNPHYSPYYLDASVPPADYLSPIPVFFLTVARNQRFRFSICPRPGAYGRKPEEIQNKETDLKVGLQLLTEALETIGAGAKTAVGYGAMRTGEALQQEQEEAEKEERNQLQQSAEQWLQETITALRNHKDFKGQPEENLWKKVLAEEWVLAQSAIKPYILELIKAQWIKLEIDWDKPPSGGAQKAKNIFSKLQSS